VWIVREAIAEPIFVRCLMNNPNPDSKLDCTPQTIQGLIHLPLRIDKQEIPYQLWYYSFGSERWVVAFTGDITSGEPVPLRIESACLFGHIFHSAKCDCGYQLDKVFRAIEICLCVCQIAIFFYESIFIGSY